MITVWLVDARRSCLVLIFAIVYGHSVPAARAAARRNWQSAIYALCAWLGLAGLKLSTVCCQTHSRPKEQLNGQRDGRTPPYLTPLRPFRPTWNKAQLSYLDPHVDLPGESDDGRMNYRARIATTVQEIGPDCNRPRGSSTSRTIQQLDVDKDRQLG
jgi:hypothetical protein